MRVASQPPWPLLSSSQSLELPVALALAVAVELQARGALLIGGGAT
jgi:hypothetical protein